MKINPLTCIDFYKADHRRQYPSGTELVVSNFTPRSGKYSNTGDKEHIVFFGLQYFLKEFLTETWESGFFDLPHDSVVEEYKKRMDRALGVGSIPVDHISALWNLGYLPIEIKALPEGSVVKVGTPVLTIHNTQPEFFWLVNYLETVMSAYLWLPCTSATFARGFRKLIDEYCLKTGAPVWFSDFQCHDFSFRGMSSLQSAVVSGAAHLLYFKGTDTVPAIDMLEEYYWDSRYDTGVDIIGASVPATEHSVMCMGGNEEGEELTTFRRLICDLYPKGIVSIVSDTWDFWKVISEYCVALRDIIVEREGKVVLRPDSGDPERILCGSAWEFDVEPSTADMAWLEENEYKGYRVDGRFYEVEFHFDSYRQLAWIAREVPGTAEMRGAVEELWEIFGGKVNEKGYRELDSHIGLIYGDSISYLRASEILARLESKGFCSNSVVFGVGSYTYQFATRDTWGWAVKATYGKVNGIGREIYKCPKTDDGIKKSAKGLLFVDKEGTISQGVSWDRFISEDNQLATVFRDGVLFREEKLGDIRERCLGKIVCSEEATSEL